MGLNLYELACPRCGGQLKECGEIYVCDCCGKTFKQQAVTDVADQLHNVLNEQNQEAIANLRRRLWQEMHEQYINSAKIISLASDVKKYLPEDYFANFCEVANCGNDREVNAFLNGTSKEDMADYADAVLDFMLKSPRAANLTAIGLFIERAFKGDTANYDKYTTKLESEAEKAKKGVYDLILTRDVFLAYSSADIDKVIELCDYLEDKQISCFMALRNLRHGRGAVDNYDQALKTAIDNCKTVVFVSSTNSRSLSCDALTKELPYIKAKDIEDAPEYKHSYDKMPAEQMMPRVEYLIEGYVGDIAESITKEFFHGLEWCKSKEAVANRITKYLTEVRETKAQKIERENRELQKKLVEMQSKKVNYAAPQANGSVAAYLKRAAQEISFCNFDEATSYYNKILDMVPECAEAWFGLMLLEFGCISDDELFSLIKKASVDDVDSYKCLFNFKHSKNCKQVAQYAEGELKERYEKLLEACDEKIFELCSVVDKRGKKFYSKIVSDNLSNPKPIKNYSCFALLLLENNCVSDDELFELFENASVDDEESYECLFNFKASNVGKQISQYAEGGLKERYKKLLAACDEKIFELCSEVDKGGKKFYERIISAELSNPEPIKTYSYYALFLLEHHCDSEEKLLSKIAACDDSDGGVNTLSIINNSLTRDGSYYMAAKASANEVADVNVSLLNIEKAIKDKIAKINGILTANNKKESETLSKLNTTISKHKGAKLAVKGSPRAFKSIDIFGVIRLCIIAAIVIAVLLLALTCWNGEWLTENADKFGFMEVIVNFFGSVFSGLASTWAEMGAELSELSGFVKFLNILLAIVSTVILLIPYILILAAYIIMSALAVFVAGIALIVLYEVLSLLIFPARKSRYNRKVHLITDYNNLCNRRSACTTRKTVLEKKINALTNGSVYKSYKTA